MPTTWDDTIALAAKIDALGDDVMGMYYTPGDDDWMTQNLLATAGLAPITEDGTIAFDTEEGRAAIALFERFHDEGGQTAISNNDARQQMYAGQARPLLQLDRRRAVLRARDRRTASTGARRRCRRWSRTAASRRAAWRR